MASEESRKDILEKLASGELSVDEAASRLEGSSEGTDDTDSAPEESAQPSGKPGRAPKYLKVTVDSHDGDRVRVQVPLSLIKAGVKLGSMLPESVTEAAGKGGVNLAALANLETDELIAALSELQVDVDGKDGDKVKVFTE